jgi:hypothetical protein
MPLDPSRIHDIQVVLAGVVFACLVGLLMEVAEQFPPVKRRNK